MVPNEQGPDTVAEKLNELMDTSGGWGTTLVFGHDFIDDPTPWNYSLQLLANEVAPMVEVQQAAASRPT